MLLGAHCRSDYEPASHRAHRRGVGGTPRRGEPRTKSAPEGDWMTSFLNDISRLDERAAHLIAGHMDGSSGSDVQDSQFGCRKRRSRTDAVAVLMNCEPSKRGGEAGCWAPFMGFESTINAIRAHLYRR